MEMRLDHVTVNSRRPVLQAVLDVVNGRVPTPPDKCHIFPLKFRRLGKSFENHFGL